MTTWPRSRVVDERPAYASLTPGHHDATTVDVPSKLSAQVWVYATGRSVRRSLHAGRP
jgi:hypothetical protein